MRLHRFYINPDTVRLDHDFWLHESAIIAQWRKVLRYREGRDVVLFDGRQHERLYKITELNNNGAHLEHVTDMERKLPKKDVYLAWSLLKKDKNDWVLQKCTELGVNHFIPLLAERCDKTGFNEARAEKIIIEAAEQCGRGNIPALREPIHPQSFVEELKGKMPIFVCEETGRGRIDNNTDKAVLLVGPEGGWSDTEKAYFETSGASIANIGDFTHRAETASVAATSKLL